MPLSTDELKILGQELASSLDEAGKPFFELKLQLGRLLSHIESEQRVTEFLDRERQSHEKEIALHAKALFGDKNDLENHQGVITTLSSLMADHKKAAKMRNSIFTSIVCLLLVELGKLLIPHIK